MTDIPDGFAPSKRLSPYLELIGPVFEAGKGPDYRLGMRVDQRHVNMRGYCHGGILAGLADVFLGRLLGHGSETPLPLITVHLGLDYLAVARLGAWLEASGRIDRIGRSLAHSSGVVTADGKPALRCTGVFQVLARDKAGAPAR